MVPSARQILCRCLTALLQHNRALITCSIWLVCLLVPGGFGVYERSCALPHARACLAAGGHRVLRDRDHERLGGAGTQRSCCLPTALDDSRGSLSCDRPRWFLPSTDTHTLAPLGPSVVSVLPSPDRRRGGGSWLRCPRLLSTVASTATMHGRGCGFSFLAFSLLFSAPFLRLLFATSPPSAKWLSCGRSVANVLVAEMRWLILSTATAFSGAPFPGVL